MTSEAFKAANRARFEADLEFVQCLANPFYLQTLAQQGVLSNPAFIQYLDYLAYFRRPSYSKFVHYPQCFHHLELLVESPAFREAIAQDASATELAKAQGEHWRTWREQLEKEEA
ncbi:suppressor of hpr1 [Cystobasidiomycetes sp. EMM_F5]